MTNWQHNQNSLQKTFVFNNFETAILFMQKASIQISKINHHPEWTNIYNKVEVKLTTHDANSTVTKKDEELSEILDQIFNQVNQ